MRRYIKKIKSILDRQITSKISPKYKLNHKDGGVINFIDVGSVGGLPEPWYSNANKVNFLLNFEPNDALKQGANSMTYNTAVWENNETRPFYIYKGFKGTGSSLFKQNYKYVRENFEELKQRGPSSLANSWFERSKLIQEVQLKCKTIDSIVLEHFPQKTFHFIKIDAQGAELNILKGAEKVLENCLGLHLELFSLPMYEGIALIDEVEKYLSGFGFELVKKFPSHGTFNSQNDCLFLRKHDDDNTIINLIKDVYRIKT